MSDDFMLTPYENPPVTAVEPTASRTFDFLTDPSHGWLKVPRALLASLGIVDKITIYSYQRGDFAYLEEHRDFGTFLESATAAGFTVKRRIRYADRPSRVRQYECFDNGQRTLQPAAS